jgi:flagellar hook-length control protein FliK
MTVNTSIAAAWINSGASVDRPSTLPNVKAGNTKAPAVETKNPEPKPENNKSISTDREAKPTEPIARKEKPDPIREDDKKTTKDESNDESTLEMMVVQLAPVPDQIETALDASVASDPVRTVMEAVKTDQSSQSQGTQQVVANESASQKGSKSSSTDEASGFETNLAKAQEGTEIAPEVVLNELNVTQMKGDDDEQIVVAESTQSTRTEEVATESEGVVQTKKSDHQEASEQSHVSTTKSTNDVDDTKQAQSSGQRGGGGGDDDGKGHNNAGNTRGLMQHGTKQTGNSNTGGTANKTKGNGAKKAADCDDSVSARKGNALDIKEWVTRNIKEKQTDKVMVDEGEEIPDIKAADPITTKEPAEATKQTETPISVNESSTSKSQGPLSTNAKLDTTAIQKQLVDRIDKMLEHRRNGRMVIHMEPRELGSLTVTIRTLGQKVDLDILASNDNVRENLKSNQNQLQNQIESKGYTVKSLDIQSSLADANQSQSGQGKETMNRQDFERVQHLTQATMVNASAVVNSSSAAASWYASSGMDLTI